MLQEPGLRPPPFGRGHTLTVRHARAPYSEDVKNKDIHIIKKCRTAGTSKATSLLHLCKYTTKKD